MPSKRRIYLKLINITNRIGFIEDELKEHCLEVEATFVRQGKERLDDALNRLRKASKRKNE